MTLAGFWNKLTDWTLSEGPLTSLGFFRIIVGFMLWRHAWAFLWRYYDDGFYRDKFYVPYWDWYPLPSETFYLFILYGIVAAGFFLIIGYRIRLSSIFGFLAVLFHLFLNQFWFRHNRYFMVLCIFLLCFAPAHKVFNLDEKKDLGWGPVWSFYLIRLQMTLIYLASAISKTMDPAWRSGKVLMGRWMNVYREPLRSIDTLPQSLIDGLSNPSLMKFFTYMALFQEYFLALCLWFPQTYKLAIWVGIVFHGYIEVGNTVLVFSYLTLSTYFLFISPAKYNRIFLYNPNLSKHRFWARLVIRMDWLEKIRFLPYNGEKLAIRDENKRWYSGKMALWIAGSVEVVPYVIAYPLSLLRWFGYGRIKDESDLENVVKSTEPKDVTQYAKDKNTMLSLIVLCISYLGFIWIVSAVPELRIKFPDIRFIDLIVFFPMLYLLTDYYRGRRLQG